MSTGAGGLDLNCETAAVLEHEAVGEAKGLKTAQVGVGVELDVGLGREAGSYQERECNQRLDGGEEELVGEQEGSAASELGGRGEEDRQRNHNGLERGEFVNYVMSSGNKEFEDESHGGNLMGLNSLEKKNVDLVSVLPQYLDVVASDQTVQLDASGGSHKWGFDVKVNDRIAIDEDASDLVGVVRSEGEVLSESEQVEVWRQSVDTFAQVNGELGLGIREGDAELHGKKLLKADMLDHGNAVLLSVSSELFDVFGESSEAIDIRDGSSVNQRGGSDVNAEGIVRQDKDSVVASGGGQGLEDKKLEESSLLGKELTEVQHGLVYGCVQAAYVDLDQVTTESEVELDGGIFLGVNSTEKESVEQVHVLAKGFVTVDSNIHIMDVDHGCGQQTQGIVVNEGEFRTDKESIATTAGGGGFNNQRLEESMVLDKKESDIHVESSDRYAQVVGGETEPDKGKTELASHGGNLLELVEGKEAHVELVAISAEGFEMQACFEAINPEDIEKGGTDVEAVFRNNEDPVTVSITGEALSKKSLDVNMEGNGSAELVALSVQEFEVTEVICLPMTLHDQSDDDQKGGTDFDAEAVVETNDGSATVAVMSGGPDDERREGSAFRIGQCMVVEGTGKSGSGVNDFITSKCIEGTVNDAVPYFGQVQKVSADEEGCGIYVEEADMVERTRETSIAISVDGSSKDESFESLCTSGEKLGIMEEDGNESAQEEKKVVKPEGGEGAWFDIIRLTGNGEGSVYCMDVQSSRFQEGVASNQKSVSCLGGVAAVDCTEVGVQLIEASQTLESAQEEANHIGDAAKLLGKGPLSMKSDDTVNDKRTCDLVVGQHAYREGEIVGESFHSQGEVDDEFAVGQTHVIEKGLAGLQESMEAGSNGVDYTLVFGHSAGYSNSQQTDFVVCKEQNVCLETCRGALPELMVEETVIDHQSVLHPGQVKCLTQEECIRLDQKICDEHPALADETLQMNSVPITVMQNLGSQQLVQFVINTVGSGNAKTDVDIDEAVNMEASRADIRDSDEIIMMDRDIVISDGSSSMHVTSAKLQNVGEGIDSNCKDSSSVMISFCRKVEHAAGIDSVGGVLVGMGDTLVEQFNSSLGSMEDFAAELGNPSVLSQENEPSTVSQGLRPSVTSTGHELVERLESEQGLTASVFSVNVVDEDIYANQSMLDGKHEVLKEPESQIEESSDTRTGFTSTSLQDTRTRFTSTSLHTTSTVHGSVEGLETEQGFTASWFGGNVVGEDIDGNQSMHDGKHEALKESENQIEESSDTRIGFTSTSQHATYYLSIPFKEGFSTSDLVWGKVKSHPWWPGQIIDLSGASELAVKYQKKDHFLIAYFGDKTFAWCEETHLKPFQLYFQQLEKQSNSDSFLRAISDILVEISRRIEFAMACLCFLEDTSADVKYQKLENAGVRGKIVNSVINRVEVITNFHPIRLLDYIKTLALLPTGGADRLELVVAHGQLKSFYRSKGYTELPAFINGSGLVENDFEVPSPSGKKPIEDDLEHSATLSDLFSIKGKSKGRDIALGKQKPVVEDGRKQKSLSDLMEEDTAFILDNGGGNVYGVLGDLGCITSEKKRKFDGSNSTDIGGRHTKKVDTQVDKDMKILPPNSTISFKVGEFISRAASKLTSGQAIRKCHGETSERSLPLTDDWRIDDIYVEDFLDIPFDVPKVQIDISVDYPSANEMLSQLCSSARNPMKGCTFLSVLISFFSAFRNLRISNFSIEKISVEKPRAKRGRKKKINSVLASPDICTPDHMKDSYWSDMIFPEKDAVVNSPKKRGRKRKSAGEPSSLNLLNLQSDCDPKLPVGTMCPHVKHVLAAERPVVSVEEKIVDERTPTAVILHFNNSNSLPSETDLIRIFSRHGPLKEAETYVDRNTCSAKVVFKKRADAEMAFSSAGKLSTFGSALVSYRLRHYPSKSSLGKTEVELECRASTDDVLDEAVGEPSSTTVQSQVRTGTPSDMSPHEVTVKELSDFIVSDVDGGMFSVETQMHEVGQVCFDVDIDPESPGKSDVSTFVVQVEDIGLSDFVQSPGDRGNTLGQTKGVVELSEFVQSHVRNVNSESKQAETASKESKADVSTQMETSAVSDHLLLESFDQGLSYFDIDNAESIDKDSSGHGNILNHIDTGEASHAAHLKSDEKESCGPAPDQLSTVTGSESNLEFGTVLEEASHLESVGEEFCISAASAEVRDLVEDAPVQDGEKLSSNSAARLVSTLTLVQGEVIREPDAMQVEALGEFTSASVVNREVAGMPSCAAEVASEERPSAVVHTVVITDILSDHSPMGSVYSSEVSVAVDSSVEDIAEEPSKVVEPGTQLGSLSLDTHT